MKTVLQTALFLAAAVAVAPAALHGADSALGDDGALYRLEAGRYDTLFPEGTAAEPEAAVLALEIAVPGEPGLRRLVPGSESAARDLSSTLLFEEGSGTVYVIWESRRDARTSSILLAGLRGDEWIGPVELSGGAAALQRAPSVLVTRDELVRPTVTQGPVLETRTVLHVVWWQQAEDGQPAVRYTPVVMENGAYVGWNPIFELDALDPNEPASNPADVDNLFRSPTLSPGTDVHTAVIAFANAETERLLTVQARVLPGELGLLADRIPDAVVAAGYGDGEDRLEAIRGTLRSHVIEIGRRFNPGLIDHFASAVVATAEVLHEEAPDRPIQAFGDELRSHVIEIGAQVLGDVGRPAFEKSGSVLEVQGDRETGDTGILSSLVHLRLVRDLPVPEGGEKASKIHVSEDGRRLLISWDTEDGVSFTESRAETAGEESEPGPWSEILALELGEEADRGLVESVLRARVLRRP